MKGCRFYRKEIKAILERQLGGREGERRGRGRRTSRMGKSVRIDPSFSSNASCVNLTLRM